MNKYLKILFYNKILYSGVLTIALILTACNSNTAPDNTAKTETAPVSDVPKYITYDIVNEYPHDPAAFTEGLEYKDGFLYESTGEYGYSELRKVELKTGKVVQSVKLDATYFGEGITILGDKIYQLTYREGKGFVYDLKTLKLLKTFAFTAPEGWGMANDGSRLIFDDGSNLLHFIDPNTFKEVKTLSVTDEHGKVEEINELEMIKGYLYANQWKADRILKIDTATGKVVGRADLLGLRHCSGIPPISGRRGDPEVMNGIAFDATNNRIFITGKYWPKVFEIKLDN